MKFIKRLFIFSFVCIILGVSAIIGIYFYLKPQLPDVATLKDVKLQTPMQVYSSDNKLIAQFGSQRRAPLRLDEMPDELLEAIIATEDSRFYSHPGIDPIGIARAIVVALKAGAVREGASTITQQVARNFFLSRDRKITRKVKEIFLAIHIEQLLTKDEILELYLNKIELGQRAFGVGAAAQIYFGKEAKDLTLSEAATIAGLPKAPSTLNPVYSVENATERRDIVLFRMLDEKYITQQEYEAAKKEKLTGKSYSLTTELDAPYVAEIARAWMVARYGEEEAYTSGMRVFTSIDSKLQQAAEKAAINNLLNYDERHGYRGAAKKIWQEDEPALTEENIITLLRKEPVYGELRPAVVTELKQKSAQIYIKDRGSYELLWDSMKWARRYITNSRQGAAPKSAADILTAGDQIWVKPLEIEVEEVDSDTEEKVVRYEQGWKLSQIPIANTAFVAMNPENGVVLSLVGGFNFEHSKFNRATQSVRQVGSGIKPFIYSAAINKGMELATLINDVPISEWDAGGGTAWRPKNSPPTYDGPTRMRIGLAQSKNVMAIRALRAVGLDDSRHFLARFGFDADKLPHSETLALGAGSLTPVKLAQGYSVFANGGYYVEPHFILKVEGPYGELEYQANPKVVCHVDCDDQVIATTVEASLKEEVIADNDNDTNNTEENNTKNSEDSSVITEADVASDAPLYAPQVITEQNAFLVREMLYSNIWGGGNRSKGTGWNGTGHRAKKLERRDIGGKTGTTNETKDTWYNGYGPGIVATVWVGFDDHKHSLGRTSVNTNFKKSEQVFGGEAGAKTAQPAWIEFMKVALEGVPQQKKVVPPGIVRVRIDRESGLLTKKSDSSTVFEYFRHTGVPKDYAEPEHDHFDLYSSPPDDSDEESLF